VSEALPERLYHYTTAEGVLGILTNSQLFASDLRFLNDARELTFARDVVVARLRQAADELAANPDDDSGAVQARVDLMRYCAYEAERVTEWLQVFVTCFCEQGDLLSQWRGYGQLAGYAIGFDRAELEASAKPPTTLRKVIYGEEAAPKLTTMVQAIIDHPAMAHTVSRGAAMAEREVIPMVVHVKDSAFSDEKEWRLATTRYTYNAGANDAEDEVYHRAGRLGITPYVKMPFERSALREIRIGPGPYPKLRQQGVESLLAGKGFGQVEVTLSGVAETFR
jgi:hypothetical protein